MADDSPFGLIREAFIKFAEAAKELINTITKSITKLARHRKAATKEQEARNRRNQLFKERAKLKRHAPPGAIRTNIDKRELVKGFRRERRPP